MINKLYWAPKTIIARFTLTNNCTRYILSFPEKLSPYDRRYNYFNCIHYRSTFNYYSTFTLEEVENLKKQLESQTGGAQYWALQIKPVRLCDKANLLFEEITEP